MKTLPPFVVFPNSVPVWRYSQELDRWGNGYKSAKARAFYDVKDAERFARRSGAGAAICQTLDGFPLIATIVQAPAHHARLITQVTWEGGAFL